MFRGLSFSDFVVRFIVVRFPEFVFLVLRCPISDFTIYDFANSDLPFSDFRFPISDCLIFDFRFVVFGFSTFRGVDTFNFRFSICRLSGFIVSVF